MNKINYIGQTDVGLIRPNNEDAFFVSPEAGYCLVADGMGGAAAGETASRIFSSTAQEIFARQCSASEKEALERVQKTFHFANEKILEHVTRHQEHEGMGCTAELLAFTDKEYVIGHIGDSRTYRLRQGNLKQLTKDHSLVQDQLDQGLITEEQARSHSMRNVILRAVGVRPAAVLDTLKGPIHSKDMFLLCSDGLTDLVDDDLIADVLTHNGSLRQKAENLIDLAKKAGGRDNITVVLAEIG